LRSAITASTSRAIDRRSLASFWNSARFLRSVASLPIRSQSSASVSSFSSLALRSSILGTTRLYGYKVHMFRSAEQIPILPFIHVRQLQRHVTRCRCSTNPVMPRHDSRRGRWLSYWGCRLMGSLQMACRGARQWRFDDASETRRPTECCRPCRPRLSAACSGNSRGSGRAATARGISQREGWRSRSKPRSR
jgi:hypothetical protein